MTVSPVPGALDICVIHSLSIGDIVHKVIEFD